MSIVHGIDVANWQGGIDWPAVEREGEVAFAWVKATEGLTFNDPYYLHNVMGAHAAGIPVGAYHFARPAAGSADLQAQHFRAYAGPLPLPAVLDAEDHWLSTVHANTDWCLRWLDSVGDPIRVIYTNRDGAIRHLDSNRLTAEGVELWYAHPGQDPDDMRGVGAWAESCSVLQYGYREVAGIAGRVDADSMTADTLARYLRQENPDTPEDDVLNPTESAALVEMAGHTVILQQIAQGTLDGIGQVVNNLAHLNRTMDEVRDRVRALTPEIPIPPPTGPPVQ